MGRSPVLNTILGFISTLEERERIYDPGSYPQTGSRPFTLRVPSDEPRRPFR